MKVKFRGYYFPLGTKEGNSHSVKSRTNFNVLSNKLLLLLQTLHSFPCNRFSLMASDARSWGVMDWGIELEIIPFPKVYSLGNPERKANSIPDVLPAPSMMVLGLWVSYLITAWPCVVCLVWEWGWRCQHEGLSAQAPVTSSPLITKWFHTIHRRGPEDITSDRNIWEWVKRTVWFSPLLPGTDDNGILVIMAHRGEMTQLKLHWLLHYQQEWWKEKKYSFEEVISISSFLVWLSVFVYLYNGMIWCANIITYLKNT